MPLNRRMAKESVEYVRIRVWNIYAMIKNIDILNSACKWMEIENPILSKIAQTQKYEYGMYSLISGL